MNEEETDKSPEKANHTKIRKTEKSTNKPKDKEEAGETSPPKSLKK